MLTVFGTPLKLPDEFYHNTDVIDLSIVASPLHLFMKTLETLPPCLIFRSNTFKKI